MKQALTEESKWLFSIGKHLLAHHRPGIIFGILLAFTSQISLLISLILPLKIIFLMAKGAETIPLPALPHLTTKTTILILAGLTVASYLIHVFSDRATITISSASVKIMAKNIKKGADSQSSTLHEQACLRYLYMIASLSFFLLGEAALLAIYPEVSVAILFFILLILGLYYLIAKNSPSKRNLLNGMARQLNSLSSVGFLVVFSCIIFDYMLFSIPGLIPLIISLVLARHVLAKAASAASTGIFLVLQRKRLTYFLEK